MGPYSPGCVVVDRKRPDRIGIVQSAKFLKHSWILVHLVHGKYQGTNVVSRSTIRPGKEADKLKIEVHLL